jgi:hypothetical protein
MLISRERFVDQFWPCVKVHALGLWSGRRKEPPDFITQTMYEAMTTSAADFPITAEEFGAIVKPVIHELHRITPKGTKPDAHDFCGRTYDALSAAGIEVGIQPPRYR